MAAPCIKANRDALSETVPTGRIVAQRPDMHVQEVKQYPGHVRQGNQICNEYALRQNSWASIPPTLPRQTRWQVQIVPGNQNPAPGRRVCPCRNGFGPLSAQFRVVCWILSSMDSRNLHLSSTAQDIDAWPSAVHPLLKRFMLGSA